MGKIVGKIIRKGRETAGVSQREIAKVLKLKTAQSISNIERGVSPLPATAVKKLSKLIDVPAEELVEAVMLEKRKKVIKAARL